MKKANLLLCLLTSFFAVIHCSAQKEENVWVFGQWAGIDFSSGSPVALTDSTAINAIHGTASVCDANGQLLFYTDGDRVWNRDHDLMPNGILFNSTIGTYFSGANQNACIVPTLDNSNRYYVFSLEKTTSTDGARLTYSIVDMALDGGLGDVVSGQSRIRLDSPTLFTEKMTAVPGDSCDVWLMTMEFGAQDWKAFRITDAGLGTTPVVSPTNTSIATYRNGYIAFSPDRQKLANVVGASDFTGPFMGTLEISDFDPATGIVSNVIDLVPQAKKPSLIFSRGVAFSPDGTKVYVTSDSVYQWNLAAGTTADIIASRIGVMSGVPITSALKTGPDGKIYITHEALAYGFLHAIESPNLSGMACNPVKDAVALKANTLGRQGVPNTVAVAIPRPTEHVRHPDTTVCITTSGALLDLLAPSGYAGYLWDDSTTDPVRVITQAGTYWVQSNDRCYPRVDTFVIQGGYIPPVQIFVDEQTLSTSGDYVSWQWYRDGAPIPGAADSSYTVDTNGVYSVKVTSANGCTDSASYTVTNVSVASWHKPVVGIYPNPAKDQVTIRADRPLRNASVQLVNIVGKVVSSQSGLTGSSFIYDTGDIPAGVYFVEVREGAFRTRVKLLKE